MLQEFFRYVLPKDIFEFFDLLEIREEGKTLHLYLDECNIIPEEYQSISLLPNGFYESSTLKDFPLRDKKVVLHLRRRRWIDSEGKSYCRCWDFAAEGTRYSKEFAFFLKGAFGYLSDSITIS